MATFILLTFIIYLFWEQCTGQIIDIGGIWEIKCPHGCSCETQKFSDLPLHRWTKFNKWIYNSFADDDIELSSGSDHLMMDEFVKVATCIISEDPEQLIASLPSDLQVFTILRSGSGNSEILLQATTFQRFTELISLEIQGIDYNDPSINDMKNIQNKSGGIILSTDALLPLGVTLLYLNLERVKLSNLNFTNKNKANLVIKPMNSDKLHNDQSITNNINDHKGHRLIFLSQQNNGESDDKEILPYDIYKQEMEGYRENAGLFTGLGALTHLRLYDCALKDISWHMFDGLDSLLYLSLEKNNLKFIPEFCFYGTPNLKLLSLANNQLLTLKSVDLAGLLMLEQLDLRENNLTFLSELSFPPFPTLQIADLRNNPMDSVFPSTFEIMNTTMQLYLGGTGSSLTLQRNSLLGLQNLEILHLYNLEVLLLERFILQGMPALLELKIRGNISGIDFDAFIDLNKLLELDLSYCHIQRISMDAFYGLENVKRIDLSNNDLAFIPPGLFTIQYQKELKEIILTKNRLTMLPWDFFKNLWTSAKLTHIQNIRLDANPWDCSCSMTSWNPHLINRIRETAPRCFTPKRLRNWGVFHALRKGGLQCKRLKRKQMSKSSKITDYEDNNDIS